MQHPKPDGPVNIGKPITSMGFARGERRRDLPADRLSLNEWALTGEWSVGTEAAQLETAGGSIAYAFQARDVNLVLTPPASGGTARFTVRVDGAPPGDDHGVDVAPSGEGTLSEPRMYQLVRQRGSVRERTLELAFDSPGVRAYVFTFG